MLEQPELPPARLDPAERAEYGSSASLEDQIQLLRRLLAGALLALVLLAMAVNLFLFRNLSMVRKDLEAVQTVVTDYEKTKDPLLTKLVSGLQGYARTHPDIHPILERYGIPPAPSAPEASSVSPLLPAPPKR